MAELEELGTAARALLTGVMDPSALYTRKSDILFSDYADAWIAFGIAGGSVVVALLLYKAIITMCMARVSYIDDYTSSIHTAVTVAGDTKSKKKTGQDDGAVRRRRRVKTRRLTQREEHRKLDDVVYGTSNNWMHLIAVFVKFGILIGGFWAAAFVGGFNVPSLLVSLGIVAYIGTHGMGSVMTNMTAAVSIWYHNHFQEGMYIEVDGEDGYIEEITLQHVILTRGSDLDRVSITLPVQTLINRPVIIVHKNNPRYIEAFNHFTSSKTRV
jgi:small-conductance mechanosensitive channel